MGRPPVIAAAVAVAVAAGLCLGVDVDNLHNGLLALSFALVGSVVLSRSAGQREAKLFLAVGVAQAVVFVGRQVGGSPDSPLPEGLTDWVAWLGIWPLPLVLVLVGATIMCFPDGGFPGRGWRLAWALMLGAGTVLAFVSAAWPVDYDRVGLIAEHPLDLPGREAASGFFDVAQPAVFTAFQVTWLWCVVTRWRGADADQARQLRWLAAALSASLVTLVGGLVVDGSPRAGLLTLPLVPVAAGIAIVESSYERLLREVQSSARRVVAAQDDARRRIERDLHDGAQHRLVVLGMELGRLVERAEASGDSGLATSARSARDQLLDASAELRELARGIHPSVLTQDGLASALSALADRSALPVRLVVDLPDGCSAEAEATAYFVTAEAMTNAIRHSGASSLTVVVAMVRDELRLEVVDDGRGGAVMQGGLRGVADRVSSVGGRLNIESPVGGGTRLEVVLPCA